MSPCDTCRRPGSCCRGFVLSFVVSDLEWETEARLKLDTYGLTFFSITEAVRTPGITPDGSVSVRCDCTLLDGNGRCGDYENRPTLCRNYNPLSDGLCCEFVGPNHLPLPVKFAEFGGC